ncbi:MAG: hypothetical protein ABSD43_13910 [Terracidiphilus sp.]|jgi:hypothetical protein
MQTIAEGRLDVLSFLENEALRRTDEKPGVYSLVRDDSGNLILFIEGFTFVGFGTVSIGGHMLDVVDGRVVKAQRPS